jgi:hypothetical protein
VNGEEYLTECGWQRVDQSMGPSGWEHPSKPGEVLSEVDALLAQGDMARPARNWASRRLPGSAAPDRWAGGFEDR